MPRLTIQAPINSLGYGVAAYNIFNTLYQGDSSVALRCIGEPEFVNSAIEAGILNQSGKSDYTVKIWHQHDLFDFVNCKTAVGFPIFELDRFSDLEKRSLRHCDQIMVCSEWAKSIVMDQCPPISYRGIDLEAFADESRVHVVPLGVDVDMFKPCQSGRKETIFFNCGKWEKRKGHDILLEAFNRAFTNEDQVELWMMCDNPFIGDMNKKWQEIYKNSPMGSKIRVIPRQKNHKDVYNIMRQTDCGVFPARAEGWNLELLEMMACGKEVIATNYSAHTEFCNEENCRLIEPDGMEEAFDGVFFGGGSGDWASFSEDSIEQLVRHMRDFHAAKTKGWVANHAGIETASNFTWENSAQELLNGLRI